MLRLVYWLVTQRTMENNVSAEQRITKEHLGNGVYAEITENHLVLTTENDRGITNTIFIKQEVWIALKNFLKREVGTLL
jgi:hypothetical protein